MENIFESLNKEWYNKLLPLLGRGYFNEMDSFVRKEQATHTIYPPAEHIFTAFNLTSPSQVKVVIVGQDPYHGKGQAHGLAFSVAPDVKIPASLRNIYKAIGLNLGVEMSPDKGSLTSWAEQGVLLINSVLTVRDGEPATHRNRGWEHFTDAVMEILSKESTNIVYVLWGKDAWKRENIVDATTNLVLKSVHPSPLSAYRGFFEANHFSATNSYLLEHDKQPIDFQIK